MVCERALAFWRVLFCVEVGIVAGGVGFIRTFERVIRRFLVDIRRNG